MKNYVIFALLIVCVATIFAAGCTDSGSSNTSATPTPQIIYVTVTVTPTATHCYWDPEKMACSDQPLTAAPTTIVATTATTAAPDPILHRWIRQYADGVTGYEFQFYPTGDVIYNQGNIVSTSGNLAIPVAPINGSGTWTKLSDTHYLVKVSFAGTSGAPSIVRDYTLVPQYGTLPEHLVSSYEQADVDNATTSGTIHNYATDVFYLERAQTD
jgi:hypothetical protein